MTEYGFSHDELHQAVRACAPARLDYRNPSFVQGFLALQLADRHPELSAKVQALPASAMAALCGDLRGQPAADDR